MICPWRFGYNPNVIRVVTRVVFIAALVLVSSHGSVALAQTTEADVYVAQAVLDFDEKRYDQALANLRRALELEPDHVEALYFTGAVYAAQRRPDLAAPFLERARAKSPQDTSIAFQIGLAYFALQQYDRAEPLFERVYKPDPTIEGLGYYVGFIRYRKKDYRGALEAFRRGRTTDPQLQRSEERRVGKECRSRWSPYH